ncbi:hypothetical protein KY084_12465 [Stakelama sp. CBK3Z-3]|uniref:Uncharacterized protein n=1 Tax=Stakelama flava TaxID=2860338 RepID=A0ABS6XN92_9SPHN|nr:hypothetical protein [Stakelama flava]MBW4331683.1 hypothetical protein [Stakelama flava]
MDATHSSPIGRALATGAGVILVGLIVALAYLSIFAWKAWDRVTPNRR